MCVRRTCAVGLNSVYCMTELGVVSVDTKQLSEYGRGECWFSMFIIRVVSVWLVWVRHSEGL